MKREINVLEYATEILTALNKGILVTTKAGEKVNTMSISWGTLGIEWGRPIFTLFVREHRYTREMLDQNPEFTINVPVGPYEKKVIGYCGTYSGRNTDKIQDMNLTLEEPLEITVPGLKEFPLTLECKVLYRQLQDKNLIPQEIREKDYPQDVDSTAPLANKDFHVAYYGEIVKAYIIEND